MDDQEMRSTHAQLAALTRAARTDGAEISAPGRAAFLKNFEDGHHCKHCGTVPPVDQSLPPAQRQRAAQAALRAHMIRLNRASAIARRTAATYIGRAQAAGQQLAEDQAQLDAATE
jgi:hypothetical protein